MVVADVQLESDQPHAGQLILVSGPSRGGKSRWAEHLVEASGRPVTYLATSAPRPGDADWQERIALHRRRRPHDWRLLESSANLAACLRTWGDGQEGPASLLVDSLGTWLAQHLGVDPQEWLGEADHTLLALRSLVQLDHLVVVVCEETGWGVVPSTSLGNLFRDRLGRFSQQLMAESDRAWLVLQGRALDLTRLSLPVPGV